MAAYSGVYVLLLAVIISILVTGNDSDSRSARRGHFISLHLAKTLCRQQRRYAEQKGTIQDPVKSRAESGSQHGCGWYQWLPNSQSYDARSCDDVGVRNTESRGERVVGGVENEVNEFPSLARIHGYHPVTNHSFLCGAIILSESWAMSAAHCFATGAEESTFYRVFAGYHNRLEHPPSIQIRNVSARSVQPPEFDYNNKWKGYDIMLLHMDEPLNFDKPGEVYKASLPEVRDDTWGTLTGWGRVSNDSLERSIVPNKLNYTMLDKSLCVKDVPQTFCAGVLAPNKSACSGDSGGPIYRLDGPKKHTVLGIVSGGSSTDCSAKEMVTIFTDVQTYVPWIKEVINGPWPRP